MLPFSDQESQLEDFKNEFLGYPGKIPHDHIQNVYGPMIKDVKLEEIFTLPHPSILKFAEVKIKSLKIRSELISNEEQKQGYINHDGGNPVGRAIQNLRTNLIGNTAQNNLSIEKLV